MIKQENTSFEAIIFDMDGVLVDSMSFHAKAWELALATKNITINKEIIYELEGSNYKQTIEIIFKKLGRIPSESEIKEFGYKQDNIFNEIKELKPFEGVKEVLDFVSQKYKLAVVSGSNKNNVNDILNNFFPGIFQVIITGDDTEKSKPSPEPYLKASKKLRIKTKNCLAIENAPLGIRSAKRAGLQCIAIATYLDGHYLEDADVILSNHKELKNYLLSLL